jgi:FdhD protein
VEHAKPALQYRYEQGSWHQVENNVVNEVLVRLHVNGRELTRLMCSPPDLDLLALGFLRSEGIIRGMQDIALLQVSANGSCVDAWLQGRDYLPPAQATITSGCSGGVTFADLSDQTEPLNSEVMISAERLSSLMFEVSAKRPTRGMHTSGLAVDGSLIVTANDVGRHNTIDKIWGHCLKEELPTGGGVLLSTGRISSEMLTKAARMRTPIVASRTSPTSLALALAAAWNITLVGYVTRDGFNVYTAPHRIVGFEEKTGDANS